MAANRHSFLQQWRDPALVPLLPLLLQKGERRRSCHPSTADALIASGMVTCLPLSTRVTIIARPTPFDRLESLGVVPRSYLPQHRRYQHAPSGLLSMLVHAPPRVVITEVAQAQRRAARLASAEARLCAEATPAPPCTLCGIGVPDAFHLTFDCPSTLTQREHILAAIRIRAQTDPELYRLTYRASDQDLLLASIGGTPFRHIRPDSPAYSNLVRLTAPNWASQFKGVYT